MTVYEAVLEELHNTPHDPDRTKGIAEYIIAHDGGCGWLPSEECDYCPCNTHDEYMLREGCGFSDNPVSCVKRVKQCQQALADMAKE